MVALSSDRESRRAVRSVKSGPPAFLGAEKGPDRIEEGKSNGLSPCQGLPRGPDTGEVAHQEREVGTRRLDEVQLPDVLPASEGRAPSPTGVQDMLEPSLHEFASLSHPPAAGV